MKYDECFQQSLLSVVIMNVSNFQVFDESFAEIKSCVK
jgi:hypothetical protein